MPFEFHDLEFLDGFFSGTVFIYERAERFAFDFGYDPEFKELSLRRCTNPLFVGGFPQHDPEKISEIRNEYWALLKSYIQEYLRTYYGYVEPECDF